MKKLLLLSFVFVLFTLPSTAKSKVKKIPDKLIVLTFDDAVSNHATLVAPLLKKYQFGATFFICEFPPDFATNKKQYMTWEQIRKIHRMGFEIGNHTGHHVCLVGLSKDSLIKELQFINHRCTEYAIPVPHSFAYPGCPSNPALLSTLSDQGIRFARTCDKRAFTPGKEDPLLIPSFAIQGSDKSLFLNAVNQAKDGQIIVLLFHGIPDVAHPWVNTPPEIFKEYMKYLHDNHFRVIAMRDLSKYL